MNRQGAWRGTLLVVSALFLALAAADSLFVAAAEQETVQDVLAAAVRTQGHSCDEAIEAKRDAGRGTSDEPAWILRCKSASYRVKLVPHQAAKIERIE